VWKKVHRTNGKNFETCYKEHLHSFRSNNTNSKCAQHHLENGQAFGKVDDIMEIKHFASKGAHMETTWRFFLYMKKVKKVNQMNDKNTFFIIKSLK
jgi:hypothetical protein